MDVRYPHYQDGEFEFKVLELLRGSGLSRRDVFAAIFMHSHIVANLGNSRLYSDAMAQDLAKGARASADALIKELETQDA